METDLIGWDFLNNCYIDLYMYFKKPKMFFLAMSPETLLISKNINVT